MSQTPESLPNNELCTSKLKHCIMLVSSAFSAPNQSPWPAFSAKGNGFALFLSSFLFESIWFMSMQSFNKFLFDFNLIKNDLFSINLAICFWYMPNPCHGSHAHVYEKRKSVCAAVERTPECRWIEWIQFRYSEMLYRNKKLESNRKIVSTDFRFFGSQTRKPFFCNLVARGAIRELFAHAQMNCGIRRRICRCSAKVWCRGVLPEYAGGVCCRTLAPQPDPRIKFRSRQ